MEYGKFVDEHRQHGSPERRRKLRNGVGYAERAFLETVWWPLMGNFDHLHPEYEVADYSGGTRFLDFAYVRGDVKLAIEIDGYATHARNVNRSQFAYGLHRQNMLILDHWNVFRFAFDEVEQHPRRCQRLIKQYMGSRFAITGNGGPHSPRLTATNREIARLARRLSRPLTPKDVKQHLDVSLPTVYRHLRHLVARGVLVPAGGTLRVRAYRLADGMSELDV